jgi:hypothetical protein
MDEKVSKASFKAYRDWQRYIKRARPKLSKGLKKSTLVAYCLSMAVDGTNGLGCYTSDATIADELDMYDYKSVSPYRNEALRLGWFVWTGEMHSRSRVLDIAIPADDAMVSRETSNLPADPRRTIPADDEPKCNCYGCWKGTGCDELEE